MKQIFGITVAAALGLVFISCSKDDAGSVEKTALEGKWLRTEKYEYDNNGYDNRVESFTFKGKTFVFESSDTGVNPLGEKWGSGHKLTGTFSCTESAFTIKVEKFYGFNNDDKQFDWHEYEEASVGESFRFRYSIENNNSLGVTAPDSFHLGGGSFLGEEGQVWYSKE